MKPVLYSLVWYAESLEPCEQAFYGRNSIWCGRTIFCDVTLLLQAINCCHLWWLWLGTRYRIWFNLLIDCRFTFLTWILLGDPKSGVLGYMCYVLAENSNTAEKILALFVLSHWKPYLCQRANLPILVEWFASVLEAQSPLETSTTRPVGQDSSLLLQ